MKFFSENLDSLRKLYIPVEIGSRCAEPGREGEDGIGEIGPTSPASTEAS